MKVTKTMPRQRKLEIKNRIPLILSEKEKLMDKEDFMKLKRELRQIIGKTPKTGYNTINGVYAINLDKYEAIANHLECDIIDLLPEQTPVKIPA